MADFIREHDRTGEQACTCPSGNGSLRWPCPQHPPTEGDDRILWGVVANAGRNSARRMARWGHVMKATGMGSGSSAELCRRFGFDPDEEIGDRDDDADDSEPCESGLPTCGPAVAWDSEGVGVCAKCAEELRQDALQGPQPGGDPA